MYKILIESLYREKKTIRYKNIGYFVKRFLIKMCKLIFVIVNFQKVTINLSTFCFISFLNFCFGESTIFRKHPLNNFKFFKADKKIVF